ncbi:hypothetical protein ACP70R_014189 [Stipagrostis hirtigluma subsp. patula]
MANAKASGAWVKRLVAEDFSRRCVEDRFCAPCAAAFCDHCCGAHHRGRGHDVVVRLAPAAAAASAVTQARRGAGPGGASRDSFCLDCAAGFSSALCTHHGGHETVDIVAISDGRHCVRCTGAEPWFHLCHGVMLQGRAGSHSGSAGAFLRWSPLFLLRPLRVLVLDDAPGGAGRRAGKPTGASRSVSVFRDSFLGTLGDALS